MPSISSRISRYLVATILPYFIFSWLLLSVILFVQQAGRYSEIFFSVNIPAELVWQLSMALVPNVIAFTCPMAMLVGTIIGLTKMQGDSELVAMRAAGVGTFQIVAPILVLGLLLSAFALLVNMKGVPLAAGLVRGIALQAAIKKFESPIEPGVFNSEVAGYTIYVKGGDLETGHWNNIFIYNEDKTSGIIRLITSKSGRIDTSAQTSELVLEDAAVSTLPPLGSSGKYVTESIAEVRFAVKTKRSDLIEKLSRSEVSADELGLQELSTYASTLSGEERVEVRLLWHRRVLLSIAPLIFGLLGAMIVLRFSRAGRGFATIAALLVVIGFYSLTFIGEQLSRTQWIDVSISWLAPVLGSLAMLMWFSLSRRFDRWGGMGHGARTIKDRLFSKSGQIRFGNPFKFVKTAIRDADLLFSLLQHFVLVLTFLISIFLFFTAFDLWRFAGKFEGGMSLLGTYLTYLLPYVYLQIAPSAAMIALLITFVVKSRRNEVVAWTAAGLSVHRLLWPCFLSFLLIGGINWMIQERFLPSANRKQDEARFALKNRGAVGNASGKVWISEDRRIYSFEYADPTQNTNARGLQESERFRLRSEFGLFMLKAGDTANAACCPSKWQLAMLTPPGLPSVSAVVASDNEKAARPCPGCIRNVYVYEFGEQGRVLQSVYRGNAAEWSGTIIRFAGPVEKNTFSNGTVETSVLRNPELTTSTEINSEVKIKPTHLNSLELRRQLQASESESDRQSLRVALGRRYSTFFLPFVLALFTAPFALSLERKGKVGSVGYAIGLWLVFTGVSTITDQLALNGQLSATLAVWGPLAGFSSIGVYLLSKVRT